MDSWIVYKPKRIVFSAASMWNDRLVLVLGQTDFVVVDVLRFKTSRNFRTSVPVLSCSRDDDNLRTHGNTRCSRLRFWSIIEKLGRWSDRCLKNLKVLQNIWTWREIKVLSLGWRTRKSSFRNVDFRFVMPLVIKQRVVIIVGWSFAKNLRQTFIT